MASSEENDGLAAKITASLERISVGLGSALWESGAEFNLTPLQIRVLLHLEGRNEGVSVGDLAAEFGVSAPTLSDALRTLTERKLTKKNRDGRRVLAVLTAEGRKTARRVGDFNEPLQQQVQRLPAARAEALLMSLLEILKGLHAAGTVRTNRSCLTCRHLQSKKAGRSFFCALMEVPLPVNALRVDCPEHQVD